MEMTQKKLSIRWLIRRDLDRVIQIENEVFDSPWQEKDFLSALKKRNCIGKVILDGEIVVGYVIYDLEKKGMSILNIAVDPVRLRTGVATQMIEQLINRLSITGRTRISVVVRETNLVAQLFFKSLGFLAKKVLKEPFDENSEDGYLMQFDAKTP